MSPTPHSHEQDVPSQAETVCGARIQITPDTPFIHYKDDVVFFCGWDCKQLYDEDPLTSCMAARLLSSK